LFGEISCLAGFYSVGSPVQSLNFSVVSLRVQSDLLQVVQPFGTVAKLVMLRAKNQVGTLIRFASFSCYY
jgi:hypothetical protein